jgi:hypothetical protein
MDNRQRTKTGEEMNKLQTELVDETFDKLIDLCIEMEKKD